MRSGELAFVSKHFSEVKDVNCKFVVSFSSRSTVLSRTSITCFDSLSQTSSANVLSSPEDTYMQFCSMKRMGVEVRNKTASTYRQFALLAPHIHVFMERVAARTLTHLA